MAEILDVGFLILDGFPAKARRREGGLFYRRDAEDAEGLLDEDEDEDEVGRSLRDRLVEHGKSHP